MDPEIPSDDPIIRTMQDPPARIPFEPEGATGSPPPNPLTNTRPDHLIGTLKDDIADIPPSPPPIPRAPNPSRPKNLGNPPVPDAELPKKPRIAYRPPNAPRPAPEIENSSAIPPSPPPMPESPFISSPHSAKSERSETPSIPTAPANEKTFTEKTPHGARASHGILTLAILTLLLAGVGFPLLWLKTNAVGNDTARAVAALTQNVGTLSSNVGESDATVKIIQDANGICRQDLFAAGANTLTCADGVSKIADAMLAEGSRFRAEGDAMKDQSKSSEGQWLIDRGNELKQNAADCAAKGADAQTRSGIPANK